MLSESDRQEVVSFEERAAGGSLSTTRLSIKRELALESPKATIIPPESQPFAIAAISLVHQAQSKLQPHHRLCSSEYHALYTLQRPDQRAILFPSKPLAIADGCFAWLPLCWLDTEIAKPFLIRYGSVTSTRDGTVPFATSSRLGMT